MNPQDALRKKWVSILLITSACVLFGIPAGIGKSDGVAASLRRHIPHTHDSAPRRAEYEVVLLTAPAPLGDAAGQGVATGQAVGTGRLPGSATPDETHAVLWPQGSGVGVDLHPPDFRHSAALDTDGQRQVGHGNGPPTAFARHALLWQGGAANYVDLHPAGNWNDSVARAVAGDQQVGNINYYFYTSYERVIVEHAALWRGSAASVVDLHPNGIGCERSYGNDTDGSRQVGYCYFSAPANTAPYRAVLWSGTPASAVVLHPPSYTHSFAEGVGGGQQVGHAFNALGGEYSRALLWRGTAASVVSLHPPGYLTSAAHATNGTLQVGSGSTPADGSHAHALLWSGTAESVVDLHTLLPAEFAGGGSVAYDIDAEGNVVGLAQRPDGPTVAVLWHRTPGAPPPAPTPTPTPTPPPSPASTPTNIAPSVQLIRPADGQRLSDNVTIQLGARASDADGRITRVSFFVNDVSVCAAATASADGVYNCGWRVTVRKPSKYRLRAQATDNRGGGSTLSRTITVTVVP